MARALGNNINKMSPQCLPSFLLGPDKNRNANFRTETEETQKEAARRNSVIYIFFPVSFVRACLTVIYSQNFTLHQLTFVKSKIARISISAITATLQQDVREFKKSAVNGRRCRA